MKRAIAAVTLAVGVVLGVAVGCGGSDGGESIFIPTPGPDGAPAGTATDGKLQGEGGAREGGDDVPRLADGGIDIDALLKSACAQDQRNASRVPVYMQFVLDGSGSMDEQGKWSAVVPAVDAIFQDFEKKADPATGAGLTIFGDQNDPTIGNTSAGPYDTNYRNQVKVAFVDAAQLRAATQLLTSTGPNSGTPMFQVLDGQYGMLAARTPPAPLEPGGRKVVVLMTDGVPDPDMGHSQQEVLTRVQQAASGGAPITTFVVGVGPFPSPDPAVYRPDFCGQLAVAGGSRSSPTCNPTETANVADVCYFQVTPPASGTPTQAQIDKLRDDFVNALNAIRQQVLTCEYRIQATGGGTVDPSKVNVIYSSGTGQQELIPASATDGYSLDDPNNPTKVVLNGPTCDKVKADTKGKVVVIVGCKAIIPR